eukprot:1145622-Pelagomonas_calceolata.AAC.4
MEEQGIKETTSSQHWHQAAMLSQQKKRTTDYDFNIHIMDFNPGEYLNVKASHTWMRCSCMLTLISSLYKLLASSGILMRTSLFLYLPPKSHKPTAPHVSHFVYLCQHIHLSPGLPAYANIISCLLLCLLIANSTNYALLFLLMPAAPHVFLALPAYATH